MEFLEVVGSRRSIRWFLPSQPVERDKIQRILEAARLTSCPGNLQPWRAIVVVASEADEGDRETLLAAGNRQRPHVLAPVWIYWYADPAGVEPAGFLGRIRELLPAGALAPGVGWTEDAVRRSILEGEPSPPGMPALERLVHDLPAEASAFIAAQETNGACVIAVLAAVNEGLGTCLHSIAVPDRHEDVKRVLGVPEHWVPVWLQLVGYPAHPRGRGWTGGPAYSGLRSTWRIAPPRRHCGNEPMWGNDRFTQMGERSSPVWATDIEGDSGGRHDEPLSESRTARPSHVDRGRPRAFASATRGD